MTAPTLLPNTTTTLQRLFAEMPRNFSRDPISTPALSISFASDVGTDTVSVVVADAKMFIYSSSSYVDTEIIFLSDKTINNLIDYFNGKYGVYGLIASRAGGTTFADANYLSTTLLEGIYDITISAETILDRFTSSNYALLGAIAVGLIDNETNMLGAIAQTDLRQTTGKWIDYWGGILGLPRLGAELGFDNSYRNRLQREVVEKKSNNYAIAKLAEQSISRKVDVVDGGQPFILSGSYNLGTLLPTQGSMLPIATLPSITFNGYIDGTTLYVMSIPTYTSPTVVNPYTGSSIVMTISNASGSSFWTATITLTGSTPAWTSAMVAGVTISAVAGSGSLGTGVVTVTSVINATTITIKSTSVISNGTITNLQLVLFAMLSANYMLSGGTISSGTTITSINNALGWTGQYTVSPSQSVGGSNNLVSITAAINATAPDASARLGPTTGAGSFIVYVQKQSDESSLPQSVIASVTTLINKWKPVGVSFKILPM